ncbi:uncharacterized protein LOC105740057 [Nomascus leucogenys]|uniref:uncharacterized protein LOC105740057 n=1 Tax=Nomascus leucogenys TaxID=61853 RepID=UPI00062A5185|nr:uncharacterized protein LOC105740057 [Nomascus leucogenys]
MLLPDKRHGGQARAGAEHTGRPRRRLPRRSGGAGEGGLGVRLGSARLPSWLPVRRRWAAESPTRRPGRAHRSILAWGLRRHRDSGPEEGRAVTRGAPNSGRLRGSPGPAARLGSDLTH